MDIHQQNSSTSAGIAEVNSEVVFNSNGVETPVGNGSYYEFENRQAIKRLEEQLSLGDDTVDPLYVQNESLDSLLSLECTENINQLAQPASGHQRPENNRLERCYGGYIGAEYHSNNLMPVKNDSDCIASACPCSLVMPSSLYINQADQGTSLLPQELGSFENLACYPEMAAPENNAEYRRVMDVEGIIGQPLEQEMRPTVAHKQKFTIQDVSPEWGYANETTKVIIIGSFLCDPTESTWSCMFGSAEVPVEIIKEGVIRCEAPPCGPGKVNLYITS